MGVKVTNNAFGTISAGINNSDTTIVLDSGQGARFPSLSSGDFFFGTLIDTSNNLEIVKVTARSTDSMTVTRGQDNTSARAFSIGDRFELRPTAALFEAIQDEAGVAGISSSADATAITIDSNETVGIKNTSPGNYLDGELTVGDSSKDQYINFVTGSTNAAGLCFQDTTGTSIVSGLRYTHNDDGLGIWAAAAQRLRVDADGLKFGTDTAAANALNDYEEGTFLPRFGGSTGNGTVYYSYMTGVYTKIGRMVRCWIDINVSSASGMSGVATIYNLPYASASSTNLGTEAAAGNAPQNATQRYDMGMMTAWDISNTFSGSRQPTGWITNGVTFFYLYTHDPSYASGHGGFGLNTTGRIAMSLIYTTD